MLSRPMVRMVTETLFGLISGSDGVGFVGKPAKIKFFPVVADSCDPKVSLLRPVNAIMAASVSGVKAGILPVCLRGDISKIGPSVVAADMVDVVDMTFRPFASLHHPDKTLRPEFLIANGKFTVAMNTYIARWLSSMFGVPRICNGTCAMRSRIKPMLAAMLPKKFAGFRIVLKQFIQDCAIKLGLSHLDLHSRSSWSGRVQVLVTPPRPIFIQQISAIFNSNLTCREI